MLRIRPAAFEDAAAICRLNQRNGMSNLDPIAWREYWAAHPFAAEFRDIPIGWVLETDEGSIVGNLDNIHLLYDLGGQQLKGVVAAGWVVDAEHRGKSLQLMTTFLRQKGVDLTLVLSASPTTARLLTSLKIARIPVPDYGTPCFWAVSHRAFAKAALSRRSAPASGLLAWPVGLALLLRDVYRGSGRGPLTSPVRRLPEFDDRFDGLWQRITASPMRLRAVRTRAMLEWRYRGDLQGGRAAIVVAERGTTLLGYAILTRRGGSDLGMDLYDIADIQAAGDDPVTMRDLFLGSIRIARAEGADALKFMSGTPAKRAPADALQPYTYHLPFWQLYFKAAAPELGTTLTAAPMWDISLFDTY